MLSSSCQKKNHGTLVSVSQYLVHHFAYLMTALDIAVLPKLKQYSSFAQVRERILAVDDELCTETFLSNLILYAPTKDDDLRTMEKYMEASDEEKAKLDIPEQFTIEVYISTYTTTLHIHDPHPYPHR